MPLRYANSILRLHCRQNRLYYPNINFRMSNTFTETNISNDFEIDFHKNHVPTNIFQRGLLTVGSAFTSLANPYRGDMIACLGETIGYDSMKYILNKMENSKEGAEILRVKPRINSKTVNLDKLKNYPDGTLGKTYSNFLKQNEVTPDTRMSVQFIDDIELAYVIQRYREIHDLTHAILGMPTNMLGEVTVKWVEAIQTRLPMCIGGAIFGPIRLKPKHSQLYRNYYLPWAIETGNNSKFLMNIFFERRWDQQLADFHLEMGIKPLVLPEN